MPCRQKRRNRAAAAAASSPGSRRSRRGGLSKNDDDTIGFPDLPLELRRMVYDFALIQPRGRTVNINSRYSPLIPSLNILVTCKAIRKEATEIFFGRNIFRIDVLSIGAFSCGGPTEKRLRWARPSQWFDCEMQPGLEKQLKKINPHSLGMIRHLEIAYHVEAPCLVDLGALKQLIPFPTLAEFVVDIRLLRKAPYFDLSFTSARSRERHRPTIDDFFPRFELDAKADFAVRGLQSLARNDIRALAYCVQVICDSPRTGGSRTKRLK